MGFFEILNTVFIGPIKFLFEMVFSLVNDRIDNPGISIICLSLAINILILPLYMRADVMQKKARDKEALLHDGIAHIKKNFSGDERMMILQTYYRQNNYSPFSVLASSVSLLLQIPFFMAAVQVLSNIPALNGASFGPIADLGKPDGLLVIGAYSINLLPILMTLINFISSALFSRGYPLKTKVQLYGLAIFFLVFLYNYPSGLVFYWLLNNVFSFVKTLFYKLKNPKKVIKILVSMVGVIAIIFGLTLITSRIKYAIVFIGVGIILQIPILWNTISKILLLGERTYTPNKNIFLLCSMFLTFLMGVLIPSSVIASSPQEFVDSALFYHPAWYILSAICLAAGTFLVWLRVFYWLATDTYKYIFEKVLLVLCGVAIVNYMFFGSELGTLSMSLQGDMTSNATAVRQAVNLAVLAVITMAILLVSRFKIIKYVLLSVVITFGALGAYNTMQIFESVSQITVTEKVSEVNYQLNTDGKNVVIIMLDRASSVYVPYILEEKPELKAQYSGFVNYSNTISYGGKTNSASPALLGGYEYTPVEMNKRDNELLATKHNEAHMVMPTIFSNNGFNVTISDPIYLDYNWTSDLSFFDDYPEINAYKTSNLFNSKEIVEEIINNNKRNFFGYSLMRVSPLFFHGIIYGNGDYNQAITYNSNEYSNTKQTIVNNQRASGYERYFLQQYRVIDNLTNMTKIENGNENTFLFMKNNITHEAMLLQLPNYTPEAFVDNSSFDIANKTEYVTVDGKKLKVETTEQITAYQANMAAFIQLGEWLDYLKENNVYDNTRIIIVADHGHDYGQIEELMLSYENGTYDLQSHFPLLLVKDFNSSGEIITSTEFMTNADVPYLAVNGLIENPVNPYTKKPISIAEKYAHEQFIVQMNKDIEQWSTEHNNGKTFLPTKWISVKSNPLDKNNWTIYDETMVLKEHSVS